MKKKVSSNGTDEVYASSCPFCELIHFIIPLFTARKSISNVVRVNHLFSIIRILKINVS
jgi:hypothetical protein